MGSRHDDHVPAPGGRCRSASGAGVVEVREIEPEMFQSVQDGLFSTLNPEIPPDRWRRLFEHEWRKDGEPRGYVLWDHDRPVGFLGLLFALPSPGDGKSPICNVTTWVVLDPYRGMSLRLLAPILPRTDWTVINLTPTAEVLRMFSALGFQELEKERCLVPLRPDRLLHLPRQARVSPVDPGRMESLPGLERHIVLHHGALVRYLRIEEGRASGLIVYGLRRIRGLPSAQLHHVTDRKLTLGALGAVQKKLFKLHRACFLEFDDRILGPGLPWGTLRRELPQPRLFRSPDRSREELTNLFTEMILLDL